MITFSIVIIAVYLLAKVFHLLAKNRELEEEKRSLKRSLDAAIGAALKLATEGG